MLKAWLKNNFLRRLYKFIQLPKKFKRYLYLFRSQGFAFVIRVTINRKVKEYPIILPLLKHPFRLRFGTADEKVFEEVMINQIYGKQLEEEPKIIIDAGANIGLASLYFASMYPNAKIIAIEPERSNFNLLKKNITEYENITAIKTALWDDVLQINIIRPQWGGTYGFQSFTNHNSNDGELVDKVTSTTLSNIMKEYHLKHIDLLKVDIEGAEKEVFNDSGNWINQVDTIMIELHDRYKPGCSEAFYNAIEGYEDLHEKSGVIFASRTK